MICPFCGANDDKVIDSRASEGGRVIRRRRECTSCDRRYTTYERAETSAKLSVVKRDGTRVAFNRENVLKGIMAACGKRAIPEETKSRIVNEIEEELYREFEREAPSRVIGEKVMSRLRGLDEVAYIRFASEYYQFESVGQLAAEIEQLKERPAEVKDQQRLF